ncbi:MAG TPA: bifunctional DNA-formamidopyrimidine glycosylase/DNA-(apurinic or apyrimidinic site) lyase [Deferrisomatales bacterium]|nr:bifunctional DNA-formamidopyrimidine glycosylase/DNA-(apurinic or apyrimidinic site) lyase [Deferrisomatales bacterium]
MPELPEVETTRRGLAPHLVGHRLDGASVRQPRLRWPVPEGLSSLLAGRRVEHLTRRGKYLLLGVGTGTLLIHLGMSGSLRLVPADTPPRRHDHLDLLVEGGQAVRLTDPRRFGAVLWTADAPSEHPLLAQLGPEPLGPEFDGGTLWQRARGRQVAVKALLMDSRVVVGVGNIYANEALFRSRIDPRRAAGRISALRFGRLAEAVRTVLTEAIEQGGTTLRDFVAGDGRPGYFQQQLQVYGRAGRPCVRCATALREVRLGQRSSVFCPRCQR